MLTSDIRTLLDQALKIYGDRDYYSPEKARASYKKGKLLKALGEQGRHSEMFLDKAWVLREKLTKKNSGLKRSIDELTDADFDDLIVFWSK
jgi:hypothetical protein